MEPVSVDRRAELGRRARDAVTQLHENRVALGEIALEVAPWSRGDRSNTGALQALAEFIEEQQIDLGVETLRRYRHVVAVWAHGSDGPMQRLPDLSWAVLRETAAGRYDEVRQEIAASTPEEHLHGLVEAGKLDKSVVERALQRTKDPRRWTVELVGLADPDGPHPPTPSLEDLEESGQTGAGQGAAIPSDSEGARRRPPGAHRKRRPGESRRSQARRRRLRGLLRGMRAVRTSVEDLHDEQETFEEPDRKEVLESVGE